MDRAAPLLVVEDLHVQYGHAQALQGVSIRLDRGVLGIVGRNGMGKTTLCNAIMGLVPTTRGSIRFAGDEIRGRSPHQIVRLGVGYVPQGRRIWPSLSVDEHLKLVAGGRKHGTWTVERIYKTFPRLAERRRNGGGQLSGGEQQMLAIARALLLNPKLLVMDEPSEGLAPIIVEQVASMLRQLADEGEISVLLIEQNLGVATGAASRIAVMVNGRVALETDATALAADLDLQQRLLGVRAAPEEAAETSPPAADEAEAGPRMFQVIRAGGEVSAPPPAIYSISRPPTLWSDHRQPIAGSADEDATPAREPAPTLEPGSLAVGKAAYVAGTFDTKARELMFVRNCLVDLGLRVVTVDLGTSRRPSPADVGPPEVARHHPKGAAAVFGNDRGASVTAMAEAFERFVLTRRDVAGIIGAGGSGATALVTPAMRRLAVGVPKVMVSTVAAGDVRRYVGASDICMMHSVTDVQGINRISEQVLANAAHALAGMMQHRRAARADAKPAIGLTMFGVTTPCVQAVQRALEAEYDCLVFHATGIGGQSMEKLVDSGLLSAVIDVTTTEIADFHVGGIMSAGEDRLGAVIRTRIPYIGSCGALDMVNWGPLDTVPERFRGRNLYRHNSSVTLMRTTAAENAEFGRWIAERLNRCEGPVRFLIPEGGVSLLDAPGQPFYDLAADAALFKALSDHVRPTENRRLVRVAANINDPLFAAALVSAFRDAAGLRTAA